MTGRPDAASADFRCVLRFGPICRPVAPSRRGLHRRLQLLIEEGEAPVNGRLLAVLSQVACLRPLHRDEVVAELAAQSVEARADGWIVSIAQPKDLTAGGDLRLDRLHVAASETEIGEACLPHLPVVG